MLQINKLLSKLDLNRNSKGMRICIISDLHCKYQIDPSDFSETFLISNMPRTPSTHHPVVSMLNCIEKNENMKSEILLSLGDLGDKADEQGIMSGWTFTNEICTKLQSKLCIGIPGNHDINSRKKNGKDAFSFIKTFHENFPTKISHKNNQFWEDGYCILIQSECLILIINTVHDHIDEEHAKFTTLKMGTLEKIIKELELEENRKSKYKICILHHHPIKHSNLNNSRDSDSFEHGDTLLNSLIKSNFNIVIHGHKHQPRIIEYSGLPVFAVGSFSSNANLQGTGFSTMFHLLELKEDSKFGIIRSWEYDKIDGWSQKYNRNFPNTIGFGANIDTHQAAKAINDMFEKNKRNPLLFSEIEENIPELKYLLPEKLIKLNNEIKEAYGLTSRPEMPLKPDIITMIING